MYVLQMTRQTFSVGCNQSIRMEYPLRPSLAEPCPTSTDLLQICISQAEDRLMERNFKKEIQEAASNPIDMADMMAQLVQVMKR